MYQKIIFNVILFVRLTAKTSAKKTQNSFGTEVEEDKMSGRRLSCLNAEQEKPEPVENKVLVIKNFKVILCQSHTFLRIQRIF